MIKYSEKTDFETFKRELLYDRFFCKTDDPMSDNYTFNYKKLPTDNDVKNSYLYKLASSMIDNDDNSFGCSVKNIFNGKEEVGIFRKNFIKGLYSCAYKLGKEKDFMLSFDNVFSIIMTYPKSKVLDMYSPDSFDSLSNSVISTNNSKESEAYKFIWDNTGYSFGKIQLHIGSNKGNYNSDVVKFLKEIGFTNDELKLLTVISDKYTKEQLKENRKVKSEMTDRVSHLNSKLKKNSKEVDDYCKKIFIERINIINSYEVLKSFIYDTELAYVQLIDYDNQLRFNKSNKYFYKYLTDKVARKDYLLTSKEIVDYKLTQLKVGKEHPELIKARNKNIIENFKPTLKNASFENVIKILDYDTLFDIITINEIGFISTNISIYNIVSRFKAEIFEILGKDNIEVTNIEINKEGEVLGETEEENTKKKIEELNSKLNIPLEFSEDTILNAHNVAEMTMVMRKLFSNFIRKYSSSETTTSGIIKETNTKFVKLCNSSNGLTSNLDKTYKSLEEINNHCKTIHSASDYDYSKTESKEADIISSYLENLYKAYGYMMNNEFAKTSLLATGVINKANAFLFSDADAMQVFADSFMSTKPKMNFEPKGDRNSPLSIFFSKSDFLYMKELDYRNLEACLRQNPYIKPSSLGCQRTWVLIYIIINFIATKKSPNKNRDDFIGHASHLLQIAKQQKWNYEYGNTEKLFSLMFPFVKYSSNPFTDMMNDKGYNTSQDTVKDLRVHIEKHMKEAVDSLKEFVYGENKVYDIFQGIADIAYELSTPISLYTDFDFSEAGESIVNQFLNACVSSLEMQTAMTIYEFLFNFEIPINGKTYTLNDLNNMLKMFNLIVEVSKDNSFVGQVENRSEVCRNTSDYQAYKQIGFYTYNKKWNNNYENMEEYIKEFTGFYLSDEPILYDIVEYCRNKKVSCKPGDLKILVQRFNNLREHEWISAYATYRLRNEDKKFSSQFEQKVFDEFEIGYLQISEMVKMFEKEADNKNPEISYINPYLENLGNDIIKNPDDFNKFKEEQIEMFKRFKINMIDNEQKCISIINKSLSDNKIYDWMMKMLPTYEMIAKAFGFASLSGIGTLDKFIDNLMKSLNMVIKITFDKWKNETMESINIRRVQFIEKERYYYLQAIPVMIDWTIKNLEQYILACNFVSEADGIDYGQLSENINKMDKIFDTFVLRLKKELSSMSSKELKEFETKLKESILSITDIDKEKVSKVIKDMFQIESMEQAVEEFGDIVNKLEPEQKKEFIEILSTKLDFAAESNDFYFSETSLRKLQGVHPRLREFALKLLSISPYDLTIVEGVRTTETQQNYYKKGRPELGGNAKDKKITNVDGVEKLSYHQLHYDESGNKYGYAIDICFAGKDLESNFSIPMYRKLISVVEKTKNEFGKNLLEEYNIQWGGYWKDPYDPPHFQYMGYKKTPKQYEELKRNNK